ncbi:nucleosome-remodeling factor subunit NURF301-like [Octopus sinensis]|uniref:Nucleosome-remodeling factor subunit NURF301-like n=1 Tax=Octopus sinensis TaxID=2607531 RepID=A0A6P7TQE5_9MOLL|nr:nucleosome-remodeling factor subunit NURF301-like [Octopus sinensis]
MSQFESTQGCSRHSCLGNDRCGRKYYLMARRVVAVSANGCQCWYYSTVHQLKRLLCCFDSSICVEKNLLEQFELSRPEIERQMRITEIITDSNKGDMMSYFDWQEKQFQNIDINDKEATKTEDLLDTKPVLSTSPKELENLYVLGKDDEYKKYVNLFSADDHNSLSKKQREEERIKKRTLFSRFNQSTDFRWHGHIYGTYKQILTSVRAS